MLSQELLSNFPVSQLRITDFVAEVRTRAGDAELILVHIEIEAGSYQKLPARMFEYYALLRMQHQKPVLPLALVLQPGAGGLLWQSHEEALFEELLLRFRCGQVGLRDLAPQPYLAGDNPVAAALTALMDLSDDDPALVKLRALQNVDESGLTRGDKHFLINAIGTYLPAAALPATGAEMLNSLPEIEKMWLDEAMEEGREEGLHFSIMSVLAARFSAPPPAIAARLAQIDNGATLEQLVTAAARVRSLDEFSSVLAAFDD